MHVCRVILEKSSQVAVARCQKCVRNRWKFCKAVWTFSAVRNKDLSWKNSLKFIGSGMMKAGSQQWQGQDTRELKLKPDIHLDIYRRVYAYKHTLEAKIK